MNLIFESTGMPFCAAKAASAKDADCILRPADEKLPPEGLADVPEELPPTPKNLLLKSDKSLD